jgi:hypothetical protein
MRLSARPVPHLQILHSAPSSRRHRHERSLSREPAPPAPVALAPVVQPGTHRSNPKQRGIPRVNANATMRERRRAGDRRMGKSGIWRQARAGMDVPAGIGGFPVVQRVRGRQVPASPARRLSRIVAFAFTRGIPLCFGFDSLRTQSGRQRSQMIIVLGFLVLIDMVDGEQVARRARRVRGRRCGTAEWLLAPFGSAVVQSARGIRGR